MLPNYDEFFIGFKDRSVIGKRLESSELVTTGDALTAHVVVVDGQLVGGWKRTLMKKAVLIGAPTLAETSVPASLQVPE